MLAQFEQREEGDRDFDAGHPVDFLVEVEQTPSLQQRAEALDEERDRWEAKRHVRERDLWRLGGKATQRLGEPDCFLRRELPLRRRREGRGAETEEAVTGLVQSLGKPRGGLLHASVLGQATRELLRGLLRPEVGKLGFLLREEDPCLQLQQRRNKDEELSAGLEIQLVPLRQQLDEREDDRRHVHVREVELLAEDERQQEVERPFEGVEIQLELAHDHRGAAYPAYRTGDLLQESAEKEQNAYKPVAVAEQITSPELVLVSPPDEAAQAREALPDYEVEFERWVVEIRAAFAAEAAEQEPERELRVIPRAEPAAAEARFTVGAFVFTAVAAVTCVAPLVLLLVFH